MSKKFDVKKLISEIEELAYGTEDLEEEEPAEKIYMRCPKCGSDDWHELRHDKFGKPTSCTDCPGKYQ